MSESTKNTYESHRCSTFSLSCPRPVKMEMKLAFMLRAIIHGTMATAIMPARIATGGEPRLLRKAMLVFGRHAGDVGMAEKDHVPVLRRVAKNRAGDMPEVEFDVDVISR